jgi:AcrR family transcriptional regulator
VATTTGTARREQLLEAAASLFGERGYHDVGIAEIGQAAGIVGSGVYRHFASKEALLASLTDRVVDRLVSGAQQIRAEASTAAAAVAELVHFHARFAIEEREMIGVYLSEERSLNPTDRRRLRRKQRAYMDEWAAAVAELRPDLDATSVAVTVHAAVSLLNSPALQRPLLPRHATEEVLTTMALSALRRPGSRPR